MGFFLKFKSKAIVKIKRAFKIDDSERYNASEVKVRNKSLGKTRPRRFAVVHKYAVKLMIPPPIGEDVFSSVPSSDFLVSISDPTRIF